MVDAVDSKSTGGNFVKVQVLSRAPKGILPPDGGPVT